MTVLQWSLVIAGGLGLFSMAAFLMATGHATLHGAAITRCILHLCGNQGSSRWFLAFIRRHLVQRRLTPCPAEAIAVPI